MVSNQYLKALVTFLMIPLINIQVILVISYSVVYIHLYTNKNIKHIGFG
jgi:hypothetical protein